MGTVCISEDDRQRITELQQLLKEQEVEKSNLKALLDEEKLKKQQIEQNGDNSADKIESLQNEKKQVFKIMLKERKTVSKLQDDIEDYKKQIKQMEDRMENLKNKSDQKKKQRLRQRLKQINKKEQKYKPDKEESESPDVNSKPRFVYGESIMSSIKKPNLDNILGKGFSNQFKRMSSKKKQQSYEDQPFKVKAKNNPNNAEKKLQENDDDDTYDAQSDYEEILSRNETLKTEALDVDLDPQVEANHIYSWLYGKKIESKNDKKELKTRLASVLTSTSEGYRQKLQTAYTEQYGGRDLLNDIKKILVKGHTMEIISNLLITSAELDAILISKMVEKWDIESVAEIICCRTKDQLFALQKAYKTKMRLSICKQLQSLAQHKNKKTLVAIIGNLFDFSKKEKKTVDINDINASLNFVLTEKKFKGDAKERLALLLTGSSVKEIQLLSQQFKLKSKDSLKTFVDKKLGNKSTTGLYCNTHIDFCQDPADYYAAKIKTLGQKFKANQTEIANIFIQRLEVDLESIKRLWISKKYSTDGKTFRKWIQTKTGDSRSGYFLMKMVDNCARYAEYNKKQREKENEKTGHKKDKFSQMMMG